MSSLVRKFTVRSSFSCAVAAIILAQLLVHSGTARAAVGDITEYPIAAAGADPTGVAAGVDGNMWVTEFMNGAIGRMTTSGVYTEFPTITPFSNPIGITAGTDGNMWFVEAAANKIGKVTPAGVVTEYPIPTASSYTTRITLGPDGYLWFTESNADKVARINSTGSITEYALLPSGAGPEDIVTGPDGYLWITERKGNKLAKVSTGGTVHVTPPSLVAEYPIPTNLAYPEGISRGTDGNVWFTEEIGNKVGKVTTTGVITEYSPTASSGPEQIIGGPDGSMWFTEAAGNNVGRITAGGAITEYPVPSAGGGPWAIAAGVDGNVWFTERAANKVAKLIVSPNCTASGLPSTRTAISTKQYSLANSDGVTWQDIDSTNLRLTCSTAATQVTLLKANADLWTANAGYNQDIGIFVSDSGGVDSLVAWKESGGSAGTFSPNAAFVQGAYFMFAGHSYVFKLKWKTNRPAPGATIFAAAGGGPAFSPSSLAAQTFPNGLAPNVAVSTAQYSLADSDGVTWQPIDATNLTTTLTPHVNATAVLGANADLWTANAGYNQDIGIFVRDNSGPDVLVAWKESGGLAGTFSPNAAFVKASYPMTAGHTYVFTLEWKTNRNAAGATIFAAAGSNPNYSPTSLVAQTMATNSNVYTNMSTSQYTLPNSDGTTWQSIDPALNLMLTPTADANAVLGANVDLWTANAGFNQDIGIFVSDNAGDDVLVAWKESGGLAGTFSPNAAFAQGFYKMTSGHTYTVKMKWKTNKFAAGATIYSAAGGPAPYSPTRLTIELTA